MTAVPPRPAAPECNCGPGHETVCHQFGTEPHFVGCPRWGEPLVTTPDATAGEGLRSALIKSLTGTRIDRGPRLYRRVTEDEAGVYADVILPALRDVLAAAARDAEKVRRVEELADELASHRGGHDADVAADIRRALDGTT